MLPWLIEVLPDNADLVILASHWLAKFLGVKTGEGCLPPSVSQLPDGQRIWAWGSVERLAKEIGMGWGQRQTQEAIEAVMETGLFRAAAQPASVTLDEEVLQELHRRHRRKLRKERRRMRASEKRPACHRGPELSIARVAEEMGWTQETTEQAIAGLMEDGLAQMGSRPGTVLVNVEALEKLERRYRRG
jgi:hypothetical protein